MIVSEIGLLYIYIYGIDKIISTFVLDFKSIFLKMFVQLKRSRMKYFK